MHIIDHNILFYLLVDDYYVKSLITQNIYIMPRERNKEIILNLYHSFGLLMSYDALSFIVL